MKDEKEQSKFTNVKIDKIKWLLGIAILASERSDCKSRKVGAVIADDSYHVLAIGYNGTVTGAKHCEGKCPRCKKGRAHTNLHDDCMAVHAEMNALMQSKGKGSKLFVTIFPCASCLKTMLNFGIKEIYYCDDYDDAKNTREYYKDLFSSRKINKEDINIHYMKFMKKQYEGEYNVPKGPSF